MKCEDFNAAIKKTRKVSNAKIMSARTKPDGISDVRWRIELRRRRMRAPNIFPDPDYMN